VVIDGLNGRREAWMRIVNGEKGRYSKMKEKATVKDASEQSECVWIGG